MPEQAVYTQNVSSAPKGEKALSTLKSNTAH